MKLTRLGRLFMNNSARAAVQRRYTAGHMLRLGGDIKGGRALEVGCGRGVGVEIILDRFGAARVDALDVDPQQIAIAQRRLARLPQERVRLFHGDATSIDAPDASFDAVFDFGAIHQIERWPAAIAEVGRVLKPRGRFFFEAIAKRLMRVGMPLAVQGGTRVLKIGFNRDSLFAELANNGIQVGISYVEPRSILIASVLGDLIGVGRKM